MATPTVERSAKRRRRESGDGAGAASPPLLAYQASTQPSPIQTSTPSADATGQVNILVTNPAGVYCDKIALGIPLGDGAGDFATTGNPPDAAVSTAKWSIATMDIVDGSQFGLAAGAKVMAITFTCRASTDYQIGYDLVFEVSGIVNLAPGDFKILIAETSGTSSSPSSMSSHMGDLTLTKAPPQFYLENLVATAPGTPSVPVTEFGNGLQIALEWESNGTWFEVYQKGQSTPVYQGTKTSCVLPGVATDTTFVLVGMVSANPATDSPAGGYTPIYLYDSITVTISNPDLTPKSVTASGNLSGAAVNASGPATFGGATTVGTPQQNAPLTVSGAAAVSGGLQAGSASVSGPLNVSGQTTLGGVSAGSMSASGQVSAGSFSTGGGGQFGSVGCSGPIVAAGGISSSGGLMTTGGSVICNTGPYNTFSGTCTGGSVCSGWFQNTGASDPGHVAGVASTVPTKSDYGFATNGYIGTFNGSAVVTHIETNDGFRVVTSPLSPAAEVHLSGHAVLSGGSAEVLLEAAHADMLHFDGEHGYRLMITPTTRCGGLAVTGKRRDRFVVEELGDGTDGEVGFDWLLIAPRRAALGASHPAGLPDALPEAKAAASPSAM